MKLRVDHNLTAVMSAVGALALIEFSMTRSFTNMTGVDVSDIVYKITRPLKVGEFDPGGMLLDTRSRISKMRRDYHQHINSVRPETDLLCAIHAGVVLIDSLTYDRRAFYEDKKTAENIPKFDEELVPLQQKAAQLHQKMISQQLGYPYEVNFDHISYHPDYPENIFHKCEGGSTAYVLRDYIEDFSVGVAGSRQEIENDAEEMRKILQDAETIRKKYNMELRPAEKALKDMFDKTLQTYPQEKSEFDRNPDSRPPKPRIRKLDSLGESEGFSR